MSFLLENARSFWRAAQLMLSEGEHNLALFHLEQALQLCLKYKLYEQYGDYPKTHSLRTLINEVSRFTTIDVDPLILDLLEDAYIGSRYLPIRYSRESVIRAMQEVGKVLKTLSCI